MCLFVAVLKRKENRFPIYIYFLIVALVESFAYFMNVNAVTYKVASLFYCAFFTMFYVNFTVRFKTLIYVLGALSLAAILFFMSKSDDNFPISIGITIAVLYIILSIIWFYEQIKYPKNQFITDRQGFWISAANLFWSVIFLFRISMMYYLAENDPAFLILLDKIFKISVILTYILLLIGLTKKQYPMNE